METTTETNNDFLPPEGRPQFLSVLCILTWICSGLIFITTVWGALFQPSQEESYEQIEKIRTMNPEAADRMEEAIESQTPVAKGLSTAFTLIGLALTTLGSVQMWNRRKKGFYLYLGGEILPYANFAFAGASGLGALGAMGGMSATTMAAIAITIMLLFDVLFIAMYAANMKHMNE
jgi:hypothetical protein